MSRSFSCTAVGYVAKLAKFVTHSVRYNSGDVPSRLLLYISALRGWGLSHCFLTVGK